MIAGKEHGKTMEAIMSGLSEEYQGLTNDIRNSNGALETMAKTMQDNAQGGVAGLKSKLEHLGIKMSEHLLPAFSKVVDFASNMIEKFSNLSPETQKNIVFFGLMAVVIPPLITGIGGLITSVSTIAGGMSFLKSTLVSASQGVGLLGKAFSFLSANPIVLVIGAIAGIVLGIMHLWKTNEAFREAVHNIWQKIVESVEWATNKVIDGVNWIIDKLNAIPMVNIKTIGHVEWSEKSKQNSLNNFKSSGNALGVSNDNSLLAKGYNSSLIDGSYATGLDFVPYDGFIAELHKGERILTAEENKNYKSGLNKLGKNKVNLFESANNKVINNNDNRQNSSTNKDDSELNFNFNITVNYQGNGNNSETDFQKLAETIAKIIMEKIKVKKLNVV